MNRDNARDAVADFTPLHWAAGDETLRPPLVKLPLANGADPNAAGGDRVGALGLVPQTPRNSEKSAMIDYVSGTAPDSEMPPKAKRKRFPAL